MSLGLVLNVSVRRNLEATVTASIIPFPLNDIVFMLIGEHCNWSIYHWRSLPLESHMMSTGIWFADVAIIVNTWDVVSIRCMADDQRTLLHY